MFRMSEVPLQGVGFTWLSAATRPVLSKRGLALRGRSILTALNLKAQPLQGYLANNKLPLPRTTVGP